jgi:4-hydroxy-3-methylbut-2-enyl diphosphate reductase
MKLLICQPRGFCAGVVRAIKTVERALRIFKPPIYVKHQIVHNKHVVNALKKEGAIFIEDIEKVPRNSYIVYSAHGVSPKIREQAKKRNLIEIDATCGLVTKIHEAAKRFSKRGYKIILIGHKNHVEIRGTAGEAPSTIVESVKDIEKLKFSEEEKIFYLTQTTLSIDDVEEIVKNLKKKYPKVETLKTSSICYATTNRQKALKGVCRETDLILVVGDPMSSNSNRLNEIAKKEGIKSFLINEASEINPNWLKRVKVIGMTAGASTPENVVQRCILYLKELGVREVEEISYIKEDVVFPLPELVS